MGLMAILKTVNDVIDALGGTSAVARLTARKPQHVSNWRSEKRIPAAKYLKMQAHLRGRRLSAPSTLWGIEPAHAANRIKKRKTKAG